MKHKDRSLKSRVSSNSSGDWSLQQYLDVDDSLWNKSLSSIPNVVAEPENQSNEKPSDRYENFRPRLIDNANQFTMSDIEQDYVMNLSFNAIGTLTSFPRFVKILSLTHNNLTNIEKLSALEYLEELDLSHNQIESLMGIQNSSTTLHVLNASNNHLQNLNGLERMLKLKHLDVSSNDITKMASVRTLGFCTALLELRFRSNPIELECPTIRLRLIDMIPSLLLLDDRKLTPPKIAASRTQERSYRSLYRNGSSMQQTTSSPASNKSSPPRYSDTTESFQKRTSPMYASTFSQTPPKRSPNCRVAAASATRRRSTPSSKPQPYYNSPRRNSTESSGGNKQRDVNMLQTQNDARAELQQRARNSNSPLDWIAIKSESFNILNEPLSCTFDDAFETSAASILVSEKNRMLRQTVEVEAALPPPPPPPQPEATVQQQKPQKTLVRSAKSQNSRTSVEWNQVGLSDDVTKRLQEIVNNKKKNLHNLTEALARFH